MSDTTTAAVATALGRIRAEMHGSMAVILRPNQELFMIDSVRGAAQTPAWEAALREVTARWALWHELERTDYVIVVDGAWVLAAWLAPHGALLVDVPPEGSFGLAKLRLRPLVEELQLALDRHSWSGEGGSGGSGAGGRVAVWAEPRKAEDGTDLDS